jgi:hypothetical protein
METHKIEPASAEKSFDAVKMMRDIRNKVSAETKDMNFDELKEYIQKQLEYNKTQQIGH